jgi:hypothetical protein
MSLNTLYDFIQVAYSMRRHYTKVEYFFKHFLFITIYLLLDQKSNHNNHYVQEINMSNFVQFTE